MFGLGGRRVVVTGVRRGPRLWPILPMVPRMLVRPLQFGPHALAPGTAIAVATTLSHQHPDLYPEPHLFRPAPAEFPRSAAVTGAASAPPSSSAR